MLSLELQDSSLTLHRLLFDNNILRHNGDRFGNCVSFLRKLLLFNYHLLRRSFIRGFNETSITACVVSIEVLLEARMNTLTVFQHALLALAAFNHDVVTTRFMFSDINCSQLVRHVIGDV